MNAVTSKNLGLSPVRVGAGRHVHWTTGGGKTLCKRDAGRSDAGAVATCARCQRVAADIAREAEDSAASPRVSAEDAIRAAGVDAPRVFLYFRLSRAADDSTSVAVQRSKTTAYTAANGWAVVGEAADVDVPGDTPLADRAGFARVRAAMESGQCTHVLVLKSDRFERDAAIRVELTRLAYAYGVTLWSVEDGAYGANVSTALRGALSEAEKLIIKGRILDSKAELRASGRWANGAPPFGWVIVKRDGGKYLAPCPETAPIVRDMVRRVIAGTRVETLTDELNASGTLSPADRNRVLQGRRPLGTRWTASVVRDMLTSWRLLGYQVWDPRPAREKVRLTASGRLERVKCKSRDLVPYLGADGTPVTVTLDGKGLVSREDFELCRETIGARTRDVTTYTTDTVLRGVAVCGTCGIPMYRNNRKAKGYAVMRCTNPECATRGSIREDALLADVERRFLATWADVRLWRDVTVSDDGGRDALARAEADLAAQSAMVARFQPGTPAFDALAARLEILSADVERLRASVADTRTTRVYDDMTLGERWYAARDNGQRRALLRDLGTVARVAPGKGPDRVHVSFTSDLADHILNALSVLDYAGDDVA